MSKTFHGKIATFNIAGYQSEVSEKQDGAHSWGDEEVNTGEGELTIKISTLLHNLFSGMKSSWMWPQVAAKSGTDQTIFDTAQQEVRDPDLDAFNDYDSVLN